MTSTRDIVGKYRSLAFAIFLIALFTSATLVSCGGGGDADGGLCSQCGNDPDGPCLESDEVSRGPDAPVPCNEPGDDPCHIFLACTRKLGSAQRRCYPGIKVKDVIIVQRDFECDGARPNVSTPFPTETPSPVLTNTPTSTPTTPTPEPTSTP
jgi:hypothetical protein